MEDFSQTRDFFIYKSTEIFWANFSEFYGNFDTLMQF